MYRNQISITLTGYPACWAGSGHGPKRALLAKIRYSEF